MINETTNRLRQKNEDAKLPTFGGYGRRQTLWVFREKHEGTVEWNSTDEKENLKRKKTAAPNVSVSCILGTLIQPRSLMLLHISNANTTFQFLKQIKGKCISMTCADFCGLLCTSKYSIFKGFATKLLIFAYTYMCEKNLSSKSYANNIYVYEAE